ncbi:hypothetical protein [Phyllobacterium sp. K27]
MTKKMAWLCAIAAIVAVAAFLVMNPLKNRTTDSQPSPHALDQSN